MESCGGAPIVRHYRPLHSLDDRRGGRGVIRFRSVGSYDVRRRVNGLAMLWIARHRHEGRGRMTDAVSDLVNVSAPGYCTHLLTTLP